MKDIFSELYNKVLGFFRQAEKKEEETAKDVACNRLKFVLMQDRTNLTPELMDRMRKELIDLLSKYVEMDKEALELGFEQEGTQMALMLSIPVVRAKDEAEIEAILAKEDEEMAQKETEATESDDSVVTDLDDSDVQNIESENDEAVSEVSDAAGDSTADGDLEVESVETVSQVTDKSKTANNNTAQNVQAAVKEEKVPVGAGTSQISK